MEKREGNFDLLRIVCAVAVIMIHVSASWVDNAINDIAERGLFIEDILSPIWLCIYNSVSRFAVPCFVMLSGAFILDNEKNTEYKSFYSKSFSRIGVPTLVFSILYIMCRIPVCFIVSNKGIYNLVSSVVRGGNQCIICGIYTCL